MRNLLHVWCFASALFLALHSKSIHTRITLWPLFIYRYHTAAFVSHVFHHDTITLAAKTVCTWVSKNESRKSLCLTMRHQTDVMWSSSHAQTSSQPAHQENSTNISIWDVFKQLKHHMVTFFAPFSNHQRGVPTQTSRSSRPLSARWGAVMEKMTRGVCRYRNMSDSFGAPQWQLLGLSRTGVFVGVGCLSGRASPEDCPLTTRRGEYPHTHRCTLALVSDLGVSSWQMGSYVTQVYGFI